LLEGVCISLETEVVRECLCKFKNKTEMCANAIWRSDVSTTPVKLFLLLYQTRQYFPDLLRHHLRVHTQCCLLLSKCPAYNANTFLYNIVAFFGRDSDFIHKSTMFVTSELVIVLDDQSCPGNENQHVQDWHCFFIKLLTAVVFNLWVARMPCKGFIIKINNYSTLNFILLSLKIQLRMNRCFGNIFSLKNKSFSRRSADTVGCSTTRWDK
jgi:hypothetical protein